jgi:curli biogenesis system outer membrane secretion channel CsgG
MRKFTHLMIVILIALTGVNSAFAQLRCYTMQAPEKIVPGMKKVAIMAFEDRKTTNWSYWDRTNTTTDYSSILNDNMLVYLMEEYRGVNQKAGKSLSGNTTRNYLDRIKTNVYTIVERSQLDAILKEQSLGASGAVSEGDAASVGKLLGLDVIVTGNFSYQTEVKQGTKTANKNKEGQVISYTYKATKTASIESSMKIISIETGELFALTTKSGSFSSKSSSQKGYSDAISKLPTDQIAITGAIKPLAWNLVSYFTPYFVPTDYDFKKPKVKDYKQDAAEAKKAIKKGDLDLAFGIIKPLYDADNYEAALAHDLGILHEAVGNYEDAIGYYTIADQLEGKKKSAKILARAESGRDALASLEAIGVVVEKHNFDASVATEAQAEMVKTSGKKKDRITAYSEPSKGSAVAAKIPGDTEFKVLGRENGFVKIELLGGKEGYVPEGDIK